MSSSQIQGLLPTDGSINTTYMAAAKGSKHATTDDDSTNVQVATHPTHSLETEQIDDELPHDSTTNSLRGLKCCLCEAATVTFGLVLSISGIVEATECEVVRELEEQHPMCRYDPAWCDMGVCDMNFSTPFAISATIIGVFMFYCGVGLCFKKPCGQQPG